MEINCSDWQGVITYSQTVELCVGGYEVARFACYSMGTLMVMKLAIRSL